MGFRPFVYRLAIRHGLVGSVRNETDNVSIEVEGVEESLDRFFRELESSPPPNARIGEITSESMPPRGECRFSIEESRARVLTVPSVSPDVATCGECLREIFDPRDRRARYAFTNCTNCGPRFTVVADSPYDRERTSMSAFPLCAPCRAEYENPLDRRYHAEATACSACGPKLLFLSPAGEEIASGDPVKLAAAGLLEGKIIAVKGLGGYHLACDASKGEAVATLRRRKARDEKPFALMVGDVDAARQLCELSPAEEDLLSSPERPIVLLRRRPNAPVTPGVAPGNAPR